MTIDKFLSELRRRNVYKVAVAYIVAGWALSQGIGQFFPVFDVPNLVIRLIVILVILGLPLALVLAWMFEITPQGIKRTETADALPASARPKKYGWVYVVTIGIAVSIGLFFLGRYTARESSSPARTPAKSIAVPPFDNLSRDPDNAYFTEGVQDEILTRLAKVADLKVISRTSTQHFKSTPDDLPQIAKQLGVANILEGTVQKAGDQVRVNVQLIDADSDSHLWAERYDRKLTDIFAVKSDIAAKIADALQAKLTGAERRAISSQPTENTEAHQFYLKGLYHWRNFFAPGYERVRDYFQRAVELDPSYAPAYAGLGSYHGFGAAHGILPPEENWQKAESALEKALTLDDTLAENYHLLAGVELYYKRDLPAAERAFRHGLELNPSFADMRHHYGICLVLFGRTAEGLTQMDHARQLDPLFPGQNLQHARIFFLMRDYDRATNEFFRTLELHPTYAAAHEYLGDACEKRGLASEAVTQWTAALNLSGEAEQATILEQTYAASGFEAAVRALAEKQLKQLQKKTSRGDYVPAW